MHHVQSHHSVYLILQLDKATIELRVLLKIKLLTVEH